MKRKGVHNLYLCQTVMMMISCFLFLFPVTRRCLHSIRQHTPGFNWHLEIWFAVWQAKMHIWKVMEGLLDMYLTETNRMYFMSCMVVWSQIPPKSRICFAMQEGLGFWTHFSDFWYTHCIAEKRFPQASKSMRAWNLEQTWGILLLLSACTLDRFPRIWGWFDQFVPSLLW